MATNYYVSKAGSNTPPYDIWARSALLIQDALNLAVSGDTVWVRAGTYVEQLTVGSGVIVRSETGLPADVILDGNNSYRVVTMVDSTNWLIGVTVTKGRAYGSIGGGTIWGKASNCIINSNFARDGGGSHGTDLLNCTITNNTATQYGGGSNGSILYNCLVSGNYAEYGAGSFQGAAYNCLYINNIASIHGGGVASTFLYNCTLSNNTKEGFYDNASWGVSPYRSISNSISWGNESDDYYDGVAIDDYSCSAVAIGSHSTRNNPQFLNPIVVDYRLSETSPCLDTGSNYPWMTDPADVRSEDLDSNPRVYPTGGIVDMGAYENIFESSSSLSSLSSFSSSASSASSVSSSSTSSVSSSSTSSGSSISSSSASSVSSISSSSVSSSSISSFSSSSLSSISSSSISSSSMSSISSSSASSSSFSSISSMSSSSASSSSVSSSSASSLSSSSSSSSSSSISSSSKSSISSPSSQSSAYLSIRYLSGLDEARLNNYTFTVGIIYPDISSTPLNLKVYRYISERIGTAGYIQYGSPVPFSLFEKVYETTIYTGPGYLEFQNQIDDIEELHRDVFEYHNRYLAYAIVQSPIIIVTSMRRTEIEPHLFSSSSISSSSFSSQSSISSLSSVSPSSSSISSLSSSTVEEHIYPIKNTTYLSTCQDENSIINPSLGWDVNMGYVGYFDKSEPTIISNHIEKHGLIRNNLNKGTIFCQNASKLFYMKAGGVSLTLSLPYDINNGIYDPLVGITNCTIQDMFIWGVNVGELYITPPGIYAAFTPYGMEFTIWSSKGRFSITDTTTTIIKNTDFTIDFAWNKNGVLTNFDANMVLFLNGVLTAWGKCPIANDNLNYLYKKENKIKGANFCLMGNLFKKIGLEGTIRRIEIYTTFPKTHLSSSSSTSSDQSYNMIRSYIELPFSFTALNENVVRLKDINFHTIIRKKIDISSTKDYGNFINKYETDSGLLVVDKTPNVSKDLPPGFEEVYQVDFSSSSLSSSSSFSSGSDSSSSLSSSSISSLSSSSISSLS
jgi:hypothetical protein